MSLSDDERNLLEAQIDEVVDYLEHWGVVVEFGGKINGFFYEDDIITISNRQSLISKFYTLLHEAGHWRLRRQDDRFAESSRSPGRKNKSQRLEVLHEEFLAWDTGYRLAEEMKLWVDDAEWKRISHKHLYDYVSWTHKPHEFGGKSGKQK